MKYYIPTSSSNLENILQSECILPIPHYAQRQTGYKTYEQIAELRNFNGIVLFKHPIKFEIKDPGRINHPLLIEFEDDVQTQDLCEIQDGVGICYHALYLTPWNCQFYFFSKEAYDITTINTKDFKAIKYYTEYHINQNASNLDLVPLPELPSRTHDDIEDSKEYIHDKLKGGLYAYLLGEQMSVTHELAVQLRLSQELYNILTAIVQEPSSKNSYIKKLSDLLAEYKKVDKVETQNERKFNEEIKNLLGKHEHFKEILFKFLEKIGALDYVIHAICEKIGIEFLPSVSILRTKEDYKGLRDLIEKRTARAITENKKNKSTSSFEKVSIDNDTLILPYSAIVNAVISHIVEEKLSEKSILEDRMLFCYNTMNIAKSKLQEQLGKNNWNDSDERNYANNLFNFIKDPSKKFDLNSTDNIELKSLAIIIQQGQDFHSCMNLCKMKELEDYRYVLTLWGCLRGYMEMDRDILDGILKPDTHKYVYEKVYGLPVREMSTKTTKTSNIDYLFNLLSILKLDTKKIELLRKGINNQQRPQLSDWDRIIDKCIKKNATIQREKAILAFKLWEKLTSREGLERIFRDHEKDLKKNATEAILDLHNHAISGNSNSVCPPHSNAPSMKDNNLAGASGQQEIDFSRDSMDSTDNNTKMENPSIERKDGIADTPVPTLETPNQKSILEDTNWIDECAKQ